MRFNTSRYIYVGGGKGALNRKWAVNVVFRRHLIFCFGQNIRQAVTGDW